VFKPPIFGAYSEMYAAFSPELRAEHNGGYIIAWGRVADLPDDIADGLTNGALAKFAEYCERETNIFV